MKNKKFELKDVVIPSWLKQVSPNSTLSTKDMAQLFGVTEKFIHQLMAEGRLPRPDIDKDYLFENPHRFESLYAKHSKKLQWRVGSVIKFINDAKKGLTT